MLRPQNAMDDIQNEINKENDPKKKYIDKTTYKSQVVDIDTNFSDGSLKITDSLAAAAKIAVEARINSVKKYTEDRIKNVNDNLKQYYSDNSVADDNKSLAKIFFPETFNATEDWSDDLYLMFANMMDELRLSDVGDSVEQFIAKSIAVSEKDDSKRLGMLRAL